MENFLHTSPMIWRQFGHFVSGLLLLEFIFLLSLAAKNVFMSQHEAENVSSWSDCTYNERRWIIFENFTNAKATNLQRMIYFQVNIYTFHSFDFTCSAGKNTLVNLQSLISLVFLQGNIYYFHISPARFLMHDTKKWYTIVSLCYSV